MAHRQNLFVAVQGHICRKSAHVCRVCQDVCDTLLQQFISVKLSCLCQSLLFSLTVCDPEPPCAKYLKTYTKVTTPYKTMQLHAIML